MLNISEKLLEFRKKMRFNQTEMAEKVGVSQRSWSNYEMGIRNPPMKVLIELEKLGFKPFKTSLELIAEETGLTLEEVKQKIDRASVLNPNLTLENAGSFIQKLETTDVISAEEYTVFRYNKSVPISIPIEKRDDPAAMVMLPLYNQLASAGPGEEPTQLGEVKSFIPIMLSLLKDADPAHCGITQVTGDSMTDIGLFPGDYAIFNTQHIDGDGIYVITVNGVTRIKRLENRPIEQKIIISSENAKRYPSPEILTYEQANEMLTIHGKVIGWIHRHLY